MSASGIIGVGRIPEKPDPDLIDTHGEPASVIDGGAVVSTNVMMDLLRGGHFNASVVGALEVSSRGDLENWLIPGVYAGGIGSSIATHCSNEAH